MHKSKTKIIKTMTRMRDYVIRGDIFLNLNQRMSATAHASPTAILLHALMQLSESDSNNV